MLIYFLTIHGKHLRSDIQKPQFYLNKCTRKYWISIFLHINSEFLLGFHTVGREIIYIRIKEYHIQLIRFLSLLLLLSIFNIIFLMDKCKFCLYICFNNISFICDLLFVIHPQIIFYRLLMTFLRFQPAVAYFFWPII